jgi:hypothetical protein
MKKLLIVSVYVVFFLGLVSPAVAQEAELLVFNLTQLQIPNKVWSNQLFPVSIYYESNLKPEELKPWIKQFSINVKGSNRQSWGTEYVPKKVDVLHVGITQRADGLTIYQGVIQTEIYLVRHWEDCTITYVLKYGPDKVTNAVFAGGILVR